MSGTVFQETCGSCFACDYRGMVVGINIYRTGGELDRFGGLCEDCLRKMLAEIGLDVREDDDYCECDCDACASCEYARPAMPDGLFPCSSSAPTCIAQVA